MRKNKKIVAILTLLMFAMSMIVPVAASAAVTDASLTPATVAVVGGEAYTLTAEVMDGDVDAGNELYLVNAAASTEVYEGTFNANRTGATFNLTAPAATDAEQTITYNLVEAANSTAAQAVTTPLATSVVTVAAKPAPTVEVESPLYVGTTGITVNLTGVEAGDTLTLLRAANAEADPVTVEGPVTLTAGATSYTFDVPVEPGTYTADLVNVSAEPDVTITSDEPVIAQEAPAGTPGIPVSDASVIEVVDKDINVDDTSTTDVVIRDSLGKRVPEGTYTIFVWAEERVGQPSTGLISVDGETESTNGVFEVTVNNVDEFEMKYARAGDYSVYASLTDPNIAVAPGEYNYGENAAYGNVAVFKSTSRVVNVESDQATVAAIGVDSMNSPNNALVTLFDGEVYGEDGADLTVGPIYVDPNGVSESDIDFVVYKYVDGFDPDDATRAERLANLEAVDIGIDVTFDTNSNAIKVSKDKDTTDYNGEVDIAVTGTVEGTYKIYVKAGGVEITVPVQVTPLRADSIRITDEPTGPIASGSYDTCGEFGFQILDPNGMVLNRPLDTDSAILGVDGLRDQLGETEDTLVGPYWNVYEGDFVNLTAPAAADLDEEDVNIIARENGEYCVTFDKDLVAGDYTLEIILDNGRKATFNWTVKDFGTAKELKIEYPRNTVELNGTTDVPDIYFLDENGVKKDASRYVDLGASGYAIKYFNTANGVVQVENDEKYIGDQIRVFAVAEREGLTAEAVLTVTSGEGSLVFDQNNGPVDFNNRVPFKVVDSEGNQLVLGTDKKIMSASVVVASQSNPDAKISGNVATYSYNDILTKGAGILNLTSDKEGTAEVKVTLVVQNEEWRDGITDAYDTQVYSGTLNYTFGDVDEYDGRIVVMVIGSADTIVDNKIVTIDAAPFVNADWRTMVPFRALAEDFGATVEWNEADQTVTAELDGVTLVMTIGSETYTVNGVEKTMDTAPVIVDGRTYVPVRFPAEAFGFDVVPTYNDEGLTSSVLFTK